MNRLLRSFALPVALLSLAGCGTPSQNARRHRVPAERRFELALLKPSHRRSCALTITREKGVPARGLNVFLDNEQIARMAPGESITLYVKPGRHYVGVKPLFSPSARRVCVLSKGESASLRILDRNGNYELQPAGGTWFDWIGRSVRSWVR